MAIPDPATTDWVPIWNPNQTIPNYQEGAWTPIFTSDGGTPTGQIYSIQQGRFAKIGSVVTCGFDIAITTVGVGGGGSLVLAGFPFLNGPIFAEGLISNFFSIITPVLWIAIQISQNTDTALIVKKTVVGSNTDGVLAFSDIQSGTRMIGQITYQTI